MLYAVVMRTELTWGTCALTLLVGCADLVGADFEDRRAFPATPSEGGAAATSSGAAAGSGATAGSGNAAGTGASSGNGGASGSSSTGGSGGLGGGGASSGGTGAVSGGAGVGGSAGAGGNAATGGIGGVGGTGGAGTGGTGGVATGGTGGTGVVDCAWKDDPFPPGPYGRNTGDVMDPLEWEGIILEPAYFPTDYSALPIEPYSLLALRQTCKRYALVHLTSTNCGGCKKNARDLNEFGLCLSNAGVAIVEVLQHLVDQSFDVELWAGYYELPVSTVQAAPDSPLLGPYENRETSFVIDLADMKILNVIESSKSDDGIKSSTRLIMPAILDQLGLPSDHCGEL